MKDDLISKTAAIDAVEGISWYHQNKNGEMVQGANSAEHQAWYKADDIYHALYTLPSAQPERKKGRWLRYGEDGYPNNEDTVFWQCDQCLEQYTGRAKRIPNFCPNCGADMRGEQDE